MIKTSLVFYLVSLVLSTPQGPDAWQGSYSVVGGRPRPRPGIIARALARPSGERPMGDYSMAVTEAAAVAQTASTIFTTCDYRGRCGFFSGGICATTIDCQTNPRLGPSWFCHRLWGSTYGMCAYRTTNGQVIFAGERDNTPAYVPPKKGTTAPPNWATVIWTTPERHPWQPCLYQPCDSSWIGRGRGRGRGRG